MMIKKRYTLQPCTELSKSKNQKVWAWWTNTGLSAAFGSESASSVSITSIQSCKFFCFVPQPPTGLQPFMNKAGLGLPIEPMFLKAPEKPTTPPQPTLPQASSLKNPPIPHFSEGSHSPLNHYRLHSPELLTAASVMQLIATKHKTLTSHCSRAGTGDLWSRMSQEASGGVVGGVYRVWGKGGGYNQGSCCWVIMGSNLAWAFLTRVS